MGDKQSRQSKSSLNDIQIDDTDDGELVIGSEKRFDVPDGLVDNSKCLYTRKNENRIKSSTIRSNGHLAHSNHTLAEEDPGDWLAAETNCVNETTDTVLSFESIAKRTSLVTNPIHLDDFERLLNLKVEDLTGKNKLNFDNTTGKDNERKDEVIGHPEDKNNKSVENTQKLDEKQGDCASQTVTDQLIVFYTNPDDIPISTKTYELSHIDYQTAIALKKVIFGTSTGILNDEWMSQGFSFCDYPKLKYGLIQKRMGPCGLFASLQAYFLIELLFENGALNPNTTLFNVKKLDRSKLLARAIAKLLWKCGTDKNQAVLCMPTSKAHFQVLGQYHSDGITETLDLIKFEKYENLFDYIWQNISTFEADKSPACLLLVYSAVLSRNIKLVQSDMDSAANTLLGQCLYCTQEMVNLLIHGKAYSNVFNDTSVCDGVTLKGPDKRNDIGFLSLKEYYKSYEVGSYLKTPKYPIWLIYLAGHFRVVFSIKKAILNDWKAEKKFDLYYYDGFAGQDEEIRLTIDSTSYMNTSVGCDNTPALELVIRTKWHDATVDWNGRDPL